MQKHLLFFTFLFSVCSFSQTFPITKKTTTTFTKHNISYTDEYTWLEDMESDEVQQWAKAQNEVINEHLQDIKKTISSASKIKEYNFYSSNGLPKKKGKYFYSMYTIEKKKSPLLFYRKKLGDISVEVANPLKIYKDENAYITDYEPSKNSRWLAIEFSHNGSDRTEVRFADMSKLEVSGEMLTGIKSNLAWHLDSGVFYRKNTNVRAFDKDSTFQLFYHKLGTSQADDSLIFDTTESENNFSFETSSDNKLLINESAKDGSYRNYYIASLNTEPFVLEKYIDHDTSDFTFLDYHDGRVYFSGKDYDWGEVRSFDIKNRADEKTVIPQLYNNLLVDTGFYEDYIICKYKTLGKIYMIVYNRDGSFVRKFDLPYAMDFSVKFLDKESKQLFVSFYSRTIPFLNYTLNLETGKSNPFFTDYLPPKTALFPFDHFETKSITYKSRDNVDVPITIVYKKGLVLDGNNPTLLKAYGGYGTVSGPNYETGLLYFLEKGGVYAYAEIRGGGEKGRKWHKAGQGLNKNNTFNDFIDAAEFLIAQKYTSAQKLAITGASHGGLVVGVAMTKRPDLFKVAIPKMGPYDMAQFGRFTVGERNYWEYGNPEIEADYKNLVGYSPCNNIKEEVNYPITLIITSDHDDRVPPVHAYKFAAKLQHRTAQKNPVYVLTYKNSGHYGSIANYDGYLNQDADFYNFLLYHLNQ